FWGGKMTQKTNLKKISVTAMLCALAYICMFVFKFKVSFLTFDFKDAILTVIAFLYGPIYAVVSSFLVAFIEFLSVSDTGVYGLIMNALSSAVFSATCGIIYKYRRTLLGAIFASVAAVLSMTAVMLVANIFITPFYMGVARADVAAMIPSLLLPFNLIKGIVNAAITMIIYKPITTALKKVGLSNNKTAKTDLKKFIPLALSALLLLIIAVIIILFALDGNFEIISKK
ncbi:MAG: ECF transporter S component, partial [Clostridia bacterium]|nr:ECF transporter S component [Clostridia bacterium]